MVNFCKGVSQIDSRFPALNYRELPAPIWRGLSRHSRGNGKRCIHKLRNAPSPIGDANGLRWRRAQGLMNAAKIVVSDVQRDCRNMVVQLFRKAVGKPAKPALAHAERKVLPFNVAR